jgi:hypothetical protein
MVKNGFYSSFEIWGQFRGAFAVSFHDHALTFQAGKVQSQRVMEKPCFPHDLPELP